MKLNEPFPTKAVLASLFAVDRPALRVVDFGADSGALGVLAGGVAGELTARWSWLLAAPVLGAGAAFVSVFVLLGIKTDDVLRCCGVALLAGFFWQPVFNAGKDYLANATEREKAAQTAAATAKLETASENLARSSNNVADIQKTAALREEPPKT